MPRLSQDRIDLLNSRIGEYAAKRILKLIQEGYVNYPDDLPALADPSQEEKRVFIEEHLDIAPNPPAPTPAPQELKPNPPAPEPSPSHEEKPKETSTDDAEAQEWEEVKQISDRRSKFVRLLRFKERYPATVHINEVDDLAWEYVLSSAHPAMTAATYQSYFPTGRHKDEVRKLKAQ